MDSSTEDSQRSPEARSLEFYRLVLESLPVAVIVVDSELRITDFNPWAEMLTGHEASAARGNFCGDIIKGGKCGAECPLKTVINLKKPSVKVETTITNKEGQTVPVLLNTSAFFDVDGTLRGALECFVDISYQKKLERERSNIVSMFAHDMKSPLVVIQGFIMRLLKEEQSLDKKEVKKYLDIIGYESGKLDALVHDFLDFSRIQSHELALNYSPTALDKELSEVVDSFREVASKRGIELAMDHGKPLSVLPADPKRLHRVFDNLLENAIKFSPDNGTVTISTRETDDDVRISFTDRGAGIEKDELPLIFDSFYRGPSSTEKTGYGMGLAVVKAIVESHGGKVLVKSEPGEGSTFTVVLPKR